MDQFYRAFEEKFRGPRQVIRTRLEQYRPFLSSLIEHHRDMNALDLGCGRGEWLELLRSLGVAAEGVDLDTHMLAACHELDLNVRQQDAIERLRQSESGSISLISAFHLVEHLEFPVLMELIIESFRVLRPGGLLILETPNAENLIVGATTFYIDPTHRRPIPPSSLLFTVQYTGFGQATVLRLQEPKDVVAKVDVAVIDILGAVSRDYAVVAQKHGDVAAVKALEPLFSATSGLTLQTLNARFEARLQRIASLTTSGRASIDDMAKVLEEIQSQVEAYAAIADQLRSELGAVRSELAKMRSRRFGERIRRQLARLKKHFGG